MSNEWSIVRLGDVVQHRKEFIEIDDFAEYKRCRVQLHAQGIVLRDTVPGVEIKTKQQQVCQAGEFLVAEIDAKLGGYGIVPEELDGAIVSSHYFLYVIEETKLDRRFLSYFVRTRDFFDQVSAKGSTNYAAIRPHHVLEYKIPLPPLDEQRRIVARIEALATKVEQAQRLRQQSVEEVEGLCRSVIFYSKEWEPKFTPMQELVSLREFDVEVIANENYHFAGTYSFGRGVFQGQVRQGAEFAYKRLTRLKSGNFVYPKLMAWEGALGVVPPECDGLVVSPEFPVFEVNEDKVLPEVLDVYFKTPSVWPIVGGLSTGTNVRRRRLQPGAFLSFKFPLPPMQVQLKLRELKQRLNPITQLQAATAARLELLLPSILDRAFRGEL